MLQTLQQELSMPATGVTIYTSDNDIEHVDAKDLEAEKSYLLRTSCWIQY